MAEGWLYRNRFTIKTAIRVVFGLVWLLDGAIKLLLDDPNSFSTMIQSIAQGQPSWLLPWFNYWSAATLQNPQFWFYFISTCEILLGLALIFGFVRKIAYSLGLLLSLVIWSVPEGFGGPYGPSSTDVGTGMIYAIVFLCLILINTEFGPSELSLDAWLEKRISWWYKLAEFGNYKPSGRKR